ncbi:hypothetical protein [Nocardioides sp. B-3]|uniref:hypothetical protein n=1 Tax=Nocardioides sp. B-3 TaxID=2895565 RepID=UPI00215316F9|nr:hypothetical protein [Nocardioides sp. B-3]UUZ58137.1 hypothetical protein LP418_17915 [Nocardioides sp. B-3]
MKAPVALIALIASAFMPITPGRPRGRRGIDRQRQRSDVHPVVHPVVPAGASGRAEGAPRRRRDPVQRR